MPVRVTVSIKTLLFINFSLLITGYVIYLKGFFPVKKSVAGLAVIRNHTVHKTQFSIPAPSYDKLVIVLIDALRADFVFDNQQRMPFLQKAIADHRARSFILRAHTPTVTLPRIKAITTGSVPGFIDIILNFDSDALTEDNILTQARQSGQQLVFFGDDTWIKLFPGHFQRSDGTTSFFVTDYTEVDVNVTRHLDRELSALDWDIMILHYLGLDHIGHTVGPKSPLVKPKLLEMDAVIKRIYQALEKQDSESASARSLILVCGDHGMSDQGSHGGASDSEVLVPAVFLSPQFTQEPDNPAASSEVREIHQQIDLAVTLSVLLGLPPPSNNLGQVLLDTLSGVTMSTLLEILHINAQQVVGLMQENMPNYQQERSYELYQYAVERHKSFLSEGDLLPDGGPRVRSQTGREVVAAYQTAIQAMTNRIAKSLTTYDLYAMTAAIALLCLNLISGFQSIWRESNHALVISVEGRVLAVVTLGMMMAMFGHVTLCTSQSYHSSMLCGHDITSIGLQLLFGTGITFLLVTIVQQMTSGSSLLSKGWTNSQFYPGSCLPLLLLAGSLCQALSLVSSSFVEEEHQVWYFLAMTFHTLVLCTVLHRGIAVALDNQGKVTMAMSNSPGNHGDHHYHHVSTDGITSVKDGSLHTLQSTLSSHQKNQKETKFHSYTETDTEQRSETANKDLRQRMDHIGGDQNKGTPWNQTDPNGKNIKNSVHLSWSVLLLWKQLLAVLIVMVIGRLARSINQTGNKWLDRPDIGDWLVRPENSFTLSMVVTGSLLALLVTRWQRVPSWPQRLLLGLGLCGVYRYRTVTMATDVLSKGISEARFVYLVILLQVDGTVAQWILPRKHKNLKWASISRGFMNMVNQLQSSWLLLMTLLVRPHNTVLVAMVAVQEVLIDSYLLQMMSLTAPYLTLLCLWMGEASFFQQGNSNSVSTVDLSSGYVGLTEYQPVIVGALLLLSTYAGPLFWFISLVKFLLSQAASRATTKADWSMCVRENILQAVKTLTICRGVNLCLYSLLTLSQRYHLFVWTVFSPKLLYELAFTGVTITVCLGLLLFSMNFSVTSC